MSMRIHRLNHENLEQAIELAERVFRIKTPSTYFTQSLDPAQPYVAYDNISSLRYWVGKKDGKVIGTTGLYSLIGQPKTSWLGWFCVDARERGNGYGDQLFAFTERMARTSGKSRLRLWTKPGDEAAHRLYLRKGMRYHPVESKKVSEEFEEELLVFGKNL